MKNLFIVCLLFFGLCGCSQSQKPVVYFENNEYRGFRDVNTYFSQQECAKVGYVVIEDGTISKNYGAVQEFIKSTDTVNSGHLRFASFHEGEGPSYMDLVYLDGEFYCYYMGEEDLSAKPYTYLLELEGSSGNPAKKYKMIVVSDDKSLTFDQVKKAMYSSSMEYTNSLGKHRIVLFNY